MHIGTVRARAFSEVRTIMVGDVVLYYTLYNMLLLFLKVYNIIYTIFYTQDARNNAERRQIRYLLAQIGGGLVGEA